MSAVAYNERVLVLGDTGSGKSELINHLFSQMRCQKVLVDTKDEWSIAGVEPARSARAIDWRLPVIHFQPADDGPGEFDAFFTAALRRRHLSVCVHELSDVCDYNANRTPRGVRAYISKGRAHGLGLIAGSQRPVEIPKRARTDLQHAIAIGPPLDADDLRTVTPIFRLSMDELTDAMLELPPYGFLWYGRDARQLTICDPLPASVRSRSTVRRVTVR